MLPHERSRPFPHREPPRHPAAHEVVLAASPLPIRKLIEQKGIARIRDLLLALDIPLSSEQQRFTELRYNLTGEGLHTLDEIREQMGTSDLTVRCLRREVEAHLLAILGNHKAGNGQAERPIALQQPAWEHPLTAATRN